MRRKGEIKHPHVKLVRSKGRTYYYFVTGRDENGRQLLARLPDPSSPQFARSLASFEAGRTRRANVAAQMTVKTMAHLYENSPHFRGLSDGTQTIYAIYLRELVSQLDAAPAAEVTRADMALLIDSMADRPAAANSVLKTTGALYAWARNRGHVPAGCDPTKDIKLLKTGEHEPWPEHVLSAALAAKDDRVRLLTHMLLYTGQRIGDVLAMTWHDVRGEQIIFTQQKTGKGMVIPMHPDLASMLANTPRRGINIVTNYRGGKLHDDLARNALKAFAADLGAKVVPHGLRKSAVNALLECGCSAAEVAAITGQTIRMVEHYAKHRSQPKLATAAVIKWKGNAK